MAAATAPSPDVSQQPPVASIIPHPPDSRSLASTLGQRSGFGPPLLQQPPPPIMGFPGAPGFLPPPNAAVASQAPSQSGSLLGQPLGEGVQPQQPPQQPPPATGSSGVGLMGAGPSLSAFPAGGEPSGEVKREVASSTSLPPNRTLYINNLNTKIKVDQLKSELRAMFENFGEVRDVVAMKSFWRRGQAWIIFANQESADKALGGLQGFPYSGKELRINYARDKSDIFAKEDGTFVSRPPGPKKPRAILEREQKLQSHLQQLQQMMLQQIQSQPLSAQQPTQFQMPFQVDHSKPLQAPPTTKEALVAAAAAQAAEAAARKRTMEPSSPQNAKIPRTSAPPTLPGGGGGFDSSFFRPAGLPPGLPHSVLSAGTTAAGQNAPNRTLFVELLPDDCTAEMIEMVFKQYPGFVEVRHIAPRKVAFVDYETDRQSSIALNVLNGFRINETHAIKVTYANR